MIVCKFGGSSMADANQIRKVRAILESNPQRRIAVVSAPGKRNREDQKITDLLYKCNEYAKKGFSCKEVFEEIENRFLEIVRDLKLDEKMCKEDLDDVRRRIDAGHGSDYAASRGEFLSGRVLAFFMGWEFVDPFEYIIIKDDNTVDPKSYSALKEALDPNKKYIIPGFYGRSVNGNVKTFTRGGSDITGSVVARAVGAELYENWTDVSGIFRANPLVIEDAEVIPELSYREVRALGDVGASVFHEEAIAPVIEANIPINVKNTNRSEDRGTMIIPETTGSGVKGISVKGGFSRIYLSKLMLFKKSGMRHALLTMLGIFGIRPSYSWFGQDSILWLFDSKMAEDATLDALKDRIKRDHQLDEIEIDRGYAILGLVGPDMDRDTQYIKVLEGLKRDFIPVVAVNYGSSKYSAIIAVREEDKDRALKSAYDSLFR